MTNRLRSSKNRVAGLLEPFGRVAGPPQRYPRGTEFFSQGDKAEVVFVLTAGLVKLQHESSAGLSAIVGLRSSGSILGGTSAILNEPYQVTACTVTQCEALRLTTPAFQELVSSRYEVSQYVHRVHAREVDSGLVHLGNFGNLTARQRLEEILSGLAEDLPQTAGEQEIPLRDWEIAKLVAITPTYLSKLIHELVDAGRLRRKGGGLLLNSSGWVRPESSAVPAPSHSDVPYRSEAEPSGQRPILPTARRASAKRSRSKH